MLKFLLCVDTARHCNLVRFSVARVSASCRHSNERRRLQQDELDTNPFLRAHDPAIRAQLGMETTDDVAVFAEIRARKDRF